jgi:hypothetical protein
MGTELVTALKVVGSNVEGGVKAGGSLVVNVVGCTGGRKSVVGVFIGIVGW